MLSPTAAAAAAAHVRGGAWPRRALIACLIGLGLTLSLLGDARADGADGPDGADSVDGQGPVLVAPISGEIDLGLTPFLERVLEDAQEMDAAAVVLPIDTPGGRLDAALEIRRTLLASDVRTIAFVDATALSAGALIAIAAEEIHVVPGGVMGAATPVLGTTGETADEKAISVVRSTFRATAQQRGRDPAIAEAMVDPDVVIEGVTVEGDLVTLDDEQMIAFGFAESIVSDLDALLVELDLADRPVEELSPSLAEGLVRILTGSLVAPLLLSLGIWLLVGDLLSGGLGIGASVGAVLLGAFFYGHLLAGLSGWEDVALVVVGVVLLLVEIFVLPGLGIAGVLGLLALLGGGVLAMLNRDLDLVSTSELLAVAGRVTLTFLLVSVAIITLFVLIARRRGGGEAVIMGHGPMGSGARPIRARWLRWFGSADVLAPDRDTDTADPPGDGAATPTPGAGRPDRPARGSLTGRTGVAVTDLHPAGVAHVDRQRIDVVTEGQWLSAGDPVIVLADEGYRRVVGRLQDDDPDPAAG